MIQPLKKTEHIFERLFVESGGIFLLFLMSIVEIRYVFKGMRRLLRQMLQVGFNTLPLASLIGLFVGMIIALETGLELKGLALENIVPNVVALAMVREMGPVITGMISSGRVGSAMAAEIGTMKVNEEVDALRSMGINPVQYLVMPRFLASILMQPLLTTYAIVIGIWGGSIVGESVLNISSQQFMQSVYRILETGDIVFGLTKTIIFAAMFSIISCSMGLKAQRGAEGVGQSTTRAVVISLTMILISDYFIGRFLG